MSESRIWIDKTSGTWGALDENLVAVNLVEVANSLECSVEEMVEEFSILSDSEISQYGQDFGIPLA